MQYDIFKSDEERKQAIQRLDELQKSEGWQILLKALDINIDYFDSRLRDEVFTDLRDVDRLQVHANHLRNLKQLPKLLIEDAHRNLEADEPTDDGDVYETPQPSSESN